jgi:V-type H+-transporting ATPase subunit a
MSLCQFYIPQEVAHSTVEELAKLEHVVEFNDVIWTRVSPCYERRLTFGSCQLNPNINPFQKHFVAPLRRLDELTRRLHFFTLLTKSLGVHVPAASLLPEQLTPQQQIDVLDPHLAQLESRLQEMNASHDTLEKRMAELVEAREVLRECEGFFQSTQRTGTASEIRQSFEEDNRPLLDAEADLEGGQTDTDSAWQGLDIEYAWHVTSMRTTHLTWTN